MSNFRKNITTFLSTGASIVPFNIWKKTNDFKIILPFYHVVSDDYLPHIHPLYEIKKVSSFISDLDFLLKHFVPIDLAAFKKHKMEGTQPLKHSFLLSFDDGLREFYDIISPVLLKKGIPAVCFLNSAFVDNKELFFRYKIGLIIEKASQDAEKRKVLEKQFGFMNYRRDLLSIRYDGIQLIDEIAKAMELNFEAFLRTQMPYMTSGQIIELKNQGFCFGGHSIDHPEYRFIGLEEQLRQTKQSVDFVQNNFSQNHRLFSFPFTDYQVSDQFFKIVREKQIAEITFGSAGLKHDPAEMNFQRIPMEVGTLTAENILAGEYLYHILKKPLGKNLISRHD